MKVWTNPIRKWCFPMIGAILILIVACQSQTDHPLDLPTAIEFNQHIRPILSQNCLVCHGPDSSTREAGLRLDNFVDATAPLEDGSFAIKPGSVSKSQLIHRIHAKNPDERMPPPEAKKTLNEREIALLERWIEQGAEWQEHWAFIAPKMPSVSRSIKRKGSSAVIDHFIQQKLKRNKLEASPPATKNQLIRRMAYLLTGLPPSQEEINFFEADSLEGHEARLVDYYLDSPHFGERWARHWMDLVRYGESMGHEGDFNISHPWQYRDYLIRAFNTDVPYDQFVKEHLAGDLIETPRYHPTEDFNESLIGTGYYFLGEGKHAPVNPKLEEADKIDNAIDVTSKTFQALTVACARCHDHKFDPIPTTDYYAMYGMFESSRIGPVPARRTRKQKKQLIELLEIKQKIRSGIAQRWGIGLAKKLPPTSAAQKVQNRPDPPLYPNLKKTAQDIHIVGDFRLGKWAGWSSDGWAFGASPLNGEVLIDADSAVFNGIQAPRASSRYVGPGVQGILRSPNFIVEHDSILIRAAGKNGLFRIIVDNFQVVQGPLYDFYQLVLNDSIPKDYVIDVSLVKGHKAFFQFMPGYYGAKGNHIYSIEPGDYIEVEYAATFQNGQPDLSLTELPVEISLDRKAAISNWIEGNANREEVEWITRLLEEKKANPLPDSLQALHQKYQHLVQDLYDSTSFLGLYEGPAIYSPVFLRGSVDNMGPEKVPHRFLSAISTVSMDYPQEGSGRLAWAQSVVHPDNPLTSRVMVNRIWHHLFGRGIVETVDNFGLQGKLPSHPELLDYLALKFVEEGWSIKKMIRHILLSQSFQRSTKVIESNRSTDPDNIFLHHFPVRRLEAEAIRDGILSVSSSLNKEMFGPPVPVYLTEFLSGRGRPHVSGPIDGDGRRSIYIAVRRNFIPEMMVAFDMPIPFTTFGRRNTTNVPAQSLMLMNDPFVQDQAACWAYHILAGTDSSTVGRIQQIYLQAFGRKATESEIAHAVNFLEKLAQRREADFDSLQHDPEIWADYCHTIFNLKEFIHLL